MRVVHQGQNDLLALALEQAFARNDAPPRSEITPQRMALIEALASQTAPKPRDQSGILNALIGMPPAPPAMTAQSDRSQAPQLGYGQQIDPQMVSALQGNFYGNLPPEMVAANAEPSRPAPAPSAGPWANYQQSSQAPSSRQPGAQMQTFEIQAQDGQVYEVQAPNQEAALEGFRSFTDKSASQPTGPWEKYQTAGTGEQNRAPSTFAEIMAKSRELYASGDVDGAKRLAGIAVQRRDAGAAPGAQASYADIMMALRNADAAGDTEAATRLAQMARDAQAREQQATMSPAQQQALADAKARRAASEGGSWRDAPVVSGGSWRDAPVIEVEGPDGVIYEFPEGTDDATMTTAMQKVYGVPQARQQGTEEAPSVPDDVRARWEAARNGTLQASPESLARHGAADAQAQAQSEEQPGYLRRGLLDFAAMGKPVHELAQKENRTAMAQKGIDGLLMGRGDEYMAGLHAVLGRDPSGQTPGFFNYGMPLGDRYDNALATVRKQEADFSQAHPLAAAGSEFAGSLVGPGKAGAQFIGRGANALSRIGRSALTGMGMGSVYGFNEGEGSLENRAVNAAKGGLFGLAGGTVTGAVGEGFRSAINAVRKTQMPEGAVPTLEGLKTTANELYDTAKNSGVTMPAQEFDNMVRGITSKVQGEGFDKGLHPQVRALLRRLGTESGPKSLADLELLRRVAGSAAKSQHPDEVRLASMAIDQIDDAVGKLGGDAEVMKSAREVWGRMRRMEAIETAVEKAGLQDDFAAGLRSQFKQMLRNPKRMRGFSETERNLMHRIATGAGGVKSLRELGDQLSLSSIASWGAMAVGAFGGAGPSVLAIPAAGFAMRKGADAMTRSGERGLLDIVAAGQNPNGNALLQMMTARNPLAPAVAGSGGVLEYLTTNPLANALAGR